MIYKDSNKDKPFFTHDKKVDDKNISGGGEMFCKTIGDFEKNKISFKSTTWRRNLKKR